MATANTLSRAFCKDVSSEGMLTPAKASSFVLGAISMLHASENCQKIRKLQRDDQDCASLFKYCEEGWPSKSKLPWSLKLFFGEQGNITVCQSMLLKGSRLIIPKCIQVEMLTWIHERQQGIVSSMGKGVRLIAEN